MTVTLYFHTHLMAKKIIATQPTPLADPLGALDETRSSLGTVAPMLSGGLGSIDAVALLEAARHIQRLLEGVVAEITRRAGRESAVPVETLLAADGTVPRTQVRAEIERTRVADVFPSVASAWRGGTVHTSNVDMLARVTRAMSADEIATLTEHDAALAEAAGRLSEESFRKRISRLRDKIRNDGGTTAAEHVIDESFARLSPSQDRSSYRLNGLFDPVRGASIKAAITREARHLADHPELCRGMTQAQIAAQALHDLVLRGDSIDRRSMPRASVRIHVLSDRDTLCSGGHDQSIAETFEGLPIGTATMGRLCCDATMRSIETAPDADVNVSRATRSPSEAQRLALRSLYGSCPISGAGWESIEIHHVIFYSESKRTVLSELVPVSRRWHHLIHDAGWKLEMDPDRTLRLSRPDGTLFKVIPPPIPINQVDLDLAA